MSNWLKKYAKGGPIKPPEPAPTPADNTKQVQAGWLSKYSIDPLPIQPAPSQSDMLLTEDQFAAKQKQDKIDAYWERVQSNPERREDQLKSHADVASGFVGVMPAHFQGNAELQKMAAYSLVFDPALAGVLGAAGQLPKVQQLGKAVSNVGKVVGMAADDMTFGASRLPGQAINKVSKTASEISSHLKGLSSKSARLSGKSTGGFKSEIDWSKWNKEIPDNKALMQEYNAIEQQSKADGTWMKNPDGSEFKGTSEQFVQQNSENFKKAYPESSKNVYRGTRKNIAELRPNRSTFTANRELASGYAPYNKKLNFLNSESTKGGVHNFYRKNSKNSLELDASNTSWTTVDLSGKKLTKEYFERNIKSQEEQILKTKDYLSKMKQEPNGSWKAPDGTLFGDDLYKNTIAERELYLKDLKERYKNIDDLISNPKELEEMKKVLGNETITDDIADYIEKRNLDYVKLKNIEDSGVGDVTIVNHKSGNYLKSAIGNNGMFDMTNPNIYKSIVPTGIGVGGVAAASKRKKMAKGGPIKPPITKKNYEFGMKKMALGGQLGDPPPNRIPRKLPRAEPNIIKPTGATLTDFYEGYDWDKIRKMKHGGWLNNYK